MAKTRIIDDIHKGATSLALLLFVCYAASFGARYFWFSDILRHFIHQYFIGALILGVFFTCRKSWLWSTIMSLTALFTAYEIISVRSTPFPPTAFERTITIANYNKLYFAPNYDALLNWIKEESPDILIIQEADPPTSNLTKTLSEYPYSIKKIPTNPFGFILLSKFPISEHKIGETQKHVLNNIYAHAVIDISENLKISLYSAHPVPPVSYIYTTQRNEDIMQMTNMIKEDSSTNIIFLGDFNITPYSPFFKDVLKTTGLKNQYTSLLPLPSWPSTYYEYIFQIPIDHILHKGDLELVDKRRGPAMGSDHYPLVATFAIPE